MFLPLIVVVGLWLLWSVWWAIAYCGAQRLYAREMPRLAQEGIELLCASQRWGGYPFRIEMTCEAPRLTVARGETEFNASSGRLTVIVQAYYLRHAIALIDGPTDIEGDRFNPIHAEHGRAALSLRLTSGGEFTLGAEIPTLNVDGRHTAARVVADVSGALDASATIIAEAQAPVLQLTRLLPLKLDSAAIATTVPGTIIAARNLAAAATPEGQITIERVELRKGPLTVTGKGTAGLDETRRPQGKLSTIVSELDPLLDEAKSVFGVKEDEATTAATMIKLLTGGKTANIPADLTLKSGAVYWGPIKIADVPGLDFALAP
jgi:hypothetical protein